MLVAVAAAVAVVIVAVVAVTVAVLCEGSEPLTGFKPAAWTALGMGVTAGLALLIEIGFGAGDLWEAGKLSSAHAVLEDACAACHDTSETVSTEKCIACHEPFGDTPGRFGFEAHYIYASGDRKRAVEHEREVGCAACHVEHRGRRTDLRTTASNRQCANCHDTGGLDQHPEFDFAAEALADDAGLAFTHIRHVGFVLDERGLDTPRDACLACHSPAAEGRGFQPIAFDSACGGCHLTGDDESPELPVQPRGVPLVRNAGDGAALRLGVETVETVRARLAPGEQWARRLRPMGFDVDDGLLVRFGVEHADPWILHNLRRLRGAVYGAGGLADLLRASADADRADRRRLYDEALATLRSRTDELRERDDDEVHAAVREFDRMVEAIERRLGDPAAAYDPTPFRLGAPDPRLTPGQLDEVDAFAARVAEPCLQCHAVERATIRRVQRTQSVLRRARYDHRPHVMLRGCLDCHARIPFADHLGSGVPVPPELDNAAIQNVPGIETCRQCHTPDLSFDRCRTCHEFHPGGR